MSFDRQIDQLCTHLVVEELLTIDADRVTVRPLRPIASVDSLKVRLNSEIDCPSMGVYAPATSTGTKQGPFKITAANNTLAVQVQNGPTITATLPLNTSMTTSRMADLLNAQIPGLYFSVTRNQLTFQTNLEGAAANVFFLASSTLGSTVGIQVGREYRGINVLPGWTLVNNPNVLADNPARMIVFDRPLKGYQDFFEVNYTTQREQCRRCGGLGVENDWLYGSDGSTVEVRDEALLIQELLKVMFTVRGSNPFHNWYGSTLIDQIGAKIASAGLLQTTIAADVQSTFQRWQSVKTQQERNVGQYVSDAEFPFKLLSVQVQQSSQDPTVFFVNSTVQNRSQQPIQISRGLKIPQPLDILGSSVAQGVYRQSLSQATLVG